jgi:DNA-binding transcriptional LysR family regulator
MDAHLRDLRYFVAVAEELSFTRAAERLYISQPALSKQVRGLEETLRARLFERDRRQVRLTAAGRALLDTARQLLGAWDEGLPAVAAADARERRVLRVGTLTSIGRALYPAALQHFAQRLPGWRIELRSFSWTDTTAGLRDRVTDAAFLWLPVDADNIERTVLVSERRYVAMSSKHRLAKRREVDFAELIDEAFVALPPEAGSLRAFWLATDERRGQEARVVAEASSADETFEIVSSGAAVHLLAEGNAIVYARPGIVCIPVRGLSPAQLAVAWRRDDRRPAVQAFVTACADAIAAGTDGATACGAIRSTPTPPAASAL